VTDRPIADWLLASRLRHLDDKGDPWTQDRLIREMQSSIGWAPFRPNYSRYETGKSTPNRETLAKFMRFWEGRGEPGPNLSVPPPGLGDTLAGGGAYLDLAGAIRELTEELRLLREAQVDGPAATAELVAQAIADTLRALGLVADPRRE
jgi:hypothetical protein